jgi:MYXO-CTERM domain-containing protein
LLLLQGSARAAPGTGTVTDTGTGTETDTSTGTETDTSTDVVDTYTGVCLTIPVEEKDPDCRCSTEESGSSLVFLAPALLAVGRRRRRREVLDRLVASEALPEDVVERLLREP